MSEAQAMTSAMARLAAQREARRPQFRTVKITEATGLATSAPLDVQVPGRSIDATKVAPVTGLAGAEVVTGQQVVILDGPTPMRLGTSPWHTSDLT